MPCAAWPRPRSGGGTQTPWTWHACGVMAPISALKTTWPCSILANERPLRVSELIRSGRSFARIEQGQVVCKAEIGAITPQACQVQGVWVPPPLRGRGHAAHGMAAVVAAAIPAIAPMVTLYVNEFNAPARAAYRRAGFTEHSRCMSVLFLSAAAKLTCLCAPSDAEELVHARRRGSGARCGAGVPRSGS